MATHAFLKHKSQSFCHNLQFPLNELKKKIDPLRNLSGAAVLLFGHWVVLTARGWSVSDRIGKSVKDGEKFLPHSIEMTHVFCKHHHVTHDSSVKDESQRVRLSRCFSSEALRCTENTKQLNPKSWSKLSADDCT